MKIRDVLTEEEQKQKLINQMTNWQNHQWNRAGAPRDMDKIKYYAELEWRSDRDNR